MLCTHTHFLRRMHQTRKGCVAQQLAHKSCKHTMDCWPVNCDILQQLAAASVAFVGQRFHTTQSKRRLNMLNLVGYMATTGIFAKTWTHE